MLRAAWMDKKITSETAIKNGVRQYLRLRGWFVFPMPGGPFSYPGVSDYCAIREGQVLFIEVKAEKGVQSQHQKSFQADIEAKGGKYLLIRSFEELKEAGY